jgi:hypothetical protein
MVMRHHLGSLLAPVLLVTGLALAGCGDDSGDVADDPAPTPSDAPSESPGNTSSGGSADFTQIALVSETAGGGSTSEEAVVLDSPAAVDDFVATFDNARMGDSIEHAIAEADVPDGQTLVGAVVAIGCDVPEEVFVRDTADGVQIVAGKVPSPHQECFAAVTTVALVAVDSGLV